MVSVTTLERAELLASIAILCSPIFLLGVLLGLSRAESKVEGGAVRAVICVFNLVATLHLCTVQQRLVKLLYRKLPGHMRTGQKIRKEMASDNSGDEQAHVRISLKGRSSSVYCRNEGLDSS